MVGAEGGIGAVPGRRWDVALSFAGAQREYVGQVAAALKARGVRCFYDADEKVRLWGMNLTEELPRIYAHESAAVVVFVSADYAAGNWTRLERRSAFSRAVDDAGVYVLPARFDDSELPGLLSDISYIDLRDCTPGQFADLVAAKLADLAISPSLISARADGRAAPRLGAGDFAVVPPRQRERVLRGLPPKSSVFAGREVDLAKLLTLLEPDGPADGQPRVAVVTGLPGVGKTELAVQAAYAALENGWFPGGVLFINMRGYDKIGR